MTHPDWPASARPPLPAGWRRRTAAELAEEDRAVRLVVRMLGVPGAVLLGLAASIVVVAARGLLA